MKEETETDARDQVQEIDTDTDRLREAQKEKVDEIVVVLTREVLAGVQEQMKEDVTRVTEGHEVDPVQWKTSKRQKGGKMTCT